MPFKRSVEYFDDTYYKKLAVCVGSFFFILLVSLSAYCMIVKFPK